MIRFSRMQNGFKLKGVNMKIITTPTNELFLISSFSDGKEVKTKAIYLADDENTAREIWLNDGSEIMKNLVDDFNG